MATPELPSRALQPLLLRRLLLLAAAVALGLLLQRVLQARLEGIVELSQRDMLAARAELARLFRLVGTAVFGLTGGVGIVLAAAFRRAGQTQPFPRIRLGIAIAVIALSLLGGGLIWYMAAVLDACRA